MINKISILFSIFPFLVLPLFGQDEEKQGRVQYSESSTIYQESLFNNTSITYSVNNTVYIEELTKHIEEFTYYSLGQYVAGVYVMRLLPQEYTNAHLMIDTRYDLNISAIFGNLAIGGGIILLTAIVLPPLAPHLPHLIGIIIKEISATTIVKASLISAASDAAISGVITYVKTGGDPELTMNKALEGAAEGFKWGAVIATGAELSNAALKIVNAGRTAETTLFTINGTLKVHPVTKVQFVTRTIVDGNGRIVKGVFPKFPSKFEAFLPNELFLSTDARQFSECIKQLQSIIARDPNLAKQFSSYQLKQIADGLTPDGLTWHHNEILGRMQLVDFLTHQQTGHTGGRSIWGGGGEFR